MTVFWRNSNRSSYSWVTAGTLVFTLPSVGGAITATMETQRREKKFQLRLINQQTNHQLF